MTIPHQINELPERAKFKRAMNQLAATLPKIQYTYKGTMGGDEVKDVMKLKRARSGEKIEREVTYEVNLHNFCNHKRALKKIIKRAKNEVEMQTNITAYILKVKQEYETAEMISKANRSKWQKFVDWCRNAFRKLIYKD